MTSHAPDTAHEKRLDGWKEIATFLGVCERTARTWASDFGLPVYRRRGRVFALPAALRLWEQTQTIHVSAKPAA